MNRFRAWLLRVLGVEAALVQLRARVTAVESERAQLRDDVNLAIEASKSHRALIAMQKCWIEALIGTVGAKHNARLALQRRYDARVEAFKKARVKLLEPEEVIPGDIPPEDGSAAGEEEASQTH